MNKKLVVFNSIANVIILISLFLGSFIWADTNGIWQLASDTRSGTFGSDEGGGNYNFSTNLGIGNNLYINQSAYINQNLIIDKNLTVNGDSCLNGECYSSWSQVCNSWVTNNAIN